MMTSNAKARRKSPQISTDASDFEEFSWEEYKLFYETTEKVVDRRLSLNAWNYGICMATLVACGFLGNWAAGKNELRLVLISVIILLSSMGFILCIHWIRQIKDLKLLNNAKFDVLNRMASKVRFPEGLPSFEVFRKEWDILDSRDATTVKWGLSVKVLKSTGSEFLLPYAFALIFAIIITVLLAIIYSNIGSLTKDPFLLPSPEISQPANAGAVAR